MARTALLPDPEELPYWFIGIAIVVSTVCLIAVSIAVVIYLGWLMLGALISSIITIHSFNCLCEEVDDNKVMVKKLKEKRDYVDEVASVDGSGLTHLAKLTSHICWTFLAADLTVLFVIASQYM